MAAGPPRLTAGRTDVSAPNARFEADNEIGACILLRPQDGDRVTRASVRREPVEDEQACHSQVAVNTYGVTGDASAAIAEYRRNAAALFRSSFKAANLSEASRNARLACSGFWVATYR